MFLCYVRPNDAKTDVIVQDSAGLLVKEFDDVFQDTLLGLSPDHSVEHVIDTGNAAPIS